MESDTCCVDFKYVFFCNIELDLDVVYMIFEIRLIGF